MIIHMLLYNLSLLAGGCLPQKTWTENYKIQNVSDMRIAVPGWLLKMRNFFPGASEELPDR
jgi:hypothetical protein